DRGRRPDGRHARRGGARGAPPHARERRFLPAPHSRGARQGLRLRERQGRQRARAGRRHARFARRDVEGWPRASGARVRGERRGAGKSQRGSRRGLRPLRAHRPRGEDARARRGNVGGHRNRLEPGSRRGLRLPHGGTPRGAGGKRRGEDAVPALRRPRADRHARSRGPHRLRRHRAGRRALRKSGDGSQTRQDRKPEPVPMTGETGHALRGDYSRKRADYTVDQEWDRYSAAEHDLWQRLYARQAALVPRYACDEFRAALATLDYGTDIPRFDAINRKLRPATRWELVAVPGLVPDLVFFDHLANRRFPVTVWIRKPEEFDYIVEPDIFHDFFGHVPMLFDPV